MLFRTLSLLGKRSFALHHILEKLLGILTSKLWILHAFVLSRIRLFATPQTVAHQNVR